MCVACECVSLCCLPQIGNPVVRLSINSDCAVKSDYYVSSCNDVRHYLIVLLYRLRPELHAEVSDSQSTTSCCVLRKSLVLLPSTPVKASANRCSHLPPNTGQHFPSCHPVAREHIDEICLLLFLIRLCSACGDCCHLIISV